MKGLGPNAGTEMSHNSQPRCLLPIGDDGVFQGIARVDSIGSKRAEFCLRAFSTLRKLVLGAESAWKLFSSLLDQVWSPNEQDLVVEIPRSMNL